MIMISRKNFLVRTIFLMDGAKKTSTAPKEKEAEAEIKKAPGGLERRAHQERKIESKINSGRATPVPPAF